MKEITSKTELLKNTITNAGFDMAEIGRTILVNADCMKVLRKLPANSIDSVVIDPPYGIGFMGKEWDNFSPKAIEKGTRNYQHGLDHKLQTGRSPSMVSGKYDKSRMGAVRFQQWSYEWSKALYRVMKPGACFLSFASPRLYHRIACAVEDAGFEIKDQLQWLYGSGFPKSRNVSKDIDRILGKKGKLIGKKKCSRKGIAVAEERTGRAAGCYGEAREVEIRESFTNEAKYWDGWGTGLKPSNEPIVLARKPLSGKSIAQNVLMWGTGAINIDATRLSSDDNYSIHHYKGKHCHRPPDEEELKKIKYTQKPDGRFPSNTIIDDEVAIQLGDKSKFFYCPKISKNERNAGCEHLELKQQNCKGKQRTYNDHCAVCGKRFIGSDTQRCKCPAGVKKTDKSVYRNKNNHPTVKPVRLMEYLVKLVTPQDGICLDIFTGSGSTGIACANLGVQFLGIEKETEFFEIAKARIQHWQKLKKVA